MVLKFFLCNRSWFLDLTLQSMEMSIALNYDVRRYGLSYEFYLCNCQAHLKKIVKAFTGKIWKAF